MVWTYNFLHQLLRPSIVTRCILILTVLFNQSLSVFGAATQNHDIKTKKGKRSSIRPTRGDKYKLLSLDARLASGGTFC